MPEVFTSPGSSPSLWTPKRIAVPVDLTQAAWNTVATHRLFTVAGAVRATTIIVARTHCAGAAGCLISFGVSLSTTIMAVAQAIANLQPGQYVVAGGAGPYQRAFLSHFNASPYWDLFTSAGFAGGVDRHIGYELTIAAATGGTFDAVCFWTPVTADGSVVAASGGAL